MKYFLILCLAVSVLSCNKKEEKSTPTLACPLLMEFEKLAVNFEFSGALPENAKLYLNSEEIHECYPLEQEFCISDIQTVGNKLNYFMYVRNKVEENLEIELYDNSAFRIARTDESLSRTRTRPKDPCGSGYISKITISEI